MDIPTRVGADVTGILPPAVCPRGALCASLRNAWPAPRGLRLAGVAANRP